MEITLPFRILISLLFGLFFFLLQLGTVMQIKIFLLYLFILCVIGKQEI